MCYTVTKNKMHSPWDASILSQDSVQAWTISLHHRLTLQTQPYRGQRWRGTGYGHKGHCNTDSYKYPGMHVNTTSTQAIAQDYHLQWLKGYIMDDVAVVNGIIMKGRCVVIPKILKTQGLDQLHVNHMGIEKTKLLASKSLYWVNINVDIEKLHYMPYISADTTKGQDNTS